MDDGLDGTLLRRKDRDMKLKISLAKSGGDELCPIATVEDEDGMSIDIAGGDGLTPRRACLSAAKSLRDAASRFEMLAREREPYQGKVHDRINRTKVTPNP